MLCGCHHQNGIAGGEIIKTRRRLDCRIQVITRQENAIAVGFVNRASDFLLESPDKDGIAVGGRDLGQGRAPRSEEHTSELQSLMRISYAVFCLKKKTICPTSLPIQLLART